MSCSSSTHPPPPNPVVCQHTERCPHECLLKTLEQVKDSQAEVEAAVGEDPLGWDYLWA